MQYLSTSSCDNDAVLRLFTEGYLLLTNTTGRSAYNQWLGGADSSSFPFYYAVFGLRKGAVTQQEVAGAYENLLDQYFAGYYGSNAAVLQLLTEAYVVLHAPSSLYTYNAVLAGDISASLSDISFKLGVDGLISVIGGSGLSPSNIGGVLGTLDLSISELGDIIGDLDLSLPDLGNLLANLNFSLTDLGDLLGDLNLPLTDLGAVLGNLNLPPSDLGGLLRNLNLPLTDLGAVLGNLNLSPSDLGGLLRNLNLSLSDLSILLGNLNFSLDNLSGVLTALDLPPSDLGDLLSNLDIPLSDLGDLLGNLGLSPSDLGDLLGNLGLSLSDLGDLLGNLGLSLSDLGDLLGNLGLSLSDLGDLLGNLGLPPNSFTGITFPVDGGGTRAGLPRVAISAYPIRGQIGVLSDTQPSFRVTLTNNGSAYTPTAPILVTLRCRQSVDAGQQTTSLISGVLPSSVTLSANSTIITMQRVPAVTGFVECVVVSDTSAEATYSVGSPSFFESYGCWWFVAFAL